MNESMHVRVPNVENINIHIMVPMKPYPNHMVRFELSPTI